MADYKWPAMSTRKAIGQRVSRIDGVEKSSGRAKYTSDYKRPNMLFAAPVTCPHAHARITKIDASAAEKMPGFKGMHLLDKEGSTVSWAMWDIGYVAAETELQARDAARAVKVEYEVLPHVVHDHDLTKAGDRVKPSGEKIEGDVDEAFKQADAVSEGLYEIPTLTHCCLEPHGSVIQFNGEKAELNPSTQAVTAIQGDCARQLEIPAANVHVHQDHIGGGFGSKFQIDRWGLASAQLSKMNGGRPVKVYLERNVELTIAGVRPSAYAKIKLAGKKDGSITAWESASWASGGLTGGGSPPIPYVFTKIPNLRQTHQAVSLNTAPIRAWRAPNHPQASFLTCSAIEDLADKLGLDPLQVYLKNAGLTARPETYVRQLNKAAELAEWKKHYHKRGDSGSGHIKRGLGIGVCTWGGAGHASTARINIHADGSAEVEIGSQDLGTGTRTIIAQVAAETFGLPVSAIKVKIGDTNYPSSGTSGGSTTVGGVSSSTRKGAVDALGKLFEEVAESLGAPADQLEAVDGKIQVKGNPAKSMTWKAACQKLGVKTITVTGTNDPRQAPREGLNTGGVGGVQIADVSVDVETGIVRMNRLIAVQDIGLVVNPKLAESQVYGACIMSICGALMEERIMDAVTGRVLNPDMEFYKIAGIKDIGDIVCHLEIDPENDGRGIIGLGEPPAVGGIAAIANAVTNAIGKRVSSVPLTPDRVLNTLEGRA
ncbi:MAG: xanthine dehydrogenase family protein molybdopterin-binding subunit [Bryobacteraceae bacterium]|nr:xanthine dehydrogenase family protein molybdopterin-binding subunit [Bryobacteraceae bacterium]